MSKATLYLEESVHKALRLKSAETRQSMSELANDALKAALLEDLEDIEDWKKEGKKRRSAMTNYCLN